ATIKRLWHLKYHMLPAMINAHETNKLTIKTINSTKPLKKRLLKAVTPPAINKANINNNVLTKSATFEPVYSKAVLQWAHWGRTPDLSVKQPATAAVIPMSSWQTGQCFPSLSAVE